MKKYKTRFLSALLTLCTLLSLVALPAQAASLGDGSTTCTVSLKERHHYLTTTAGTALGASAYQYTSNDGLSGPAYCIDHGLSLTSDALLITGKYDANPSTAGAFANGYPQHTVAIFLGLYLDENSILSGLTEDEYAYATQIAIWATLGQLAVDGTGFASGRERLKQPTGDSQQMRVFRAVQLMLKTAKSWDRVPQTGMYIRLEDNKLGGNIYIPPHMTLDYAAKEQQYGLRCEVIGGKSYYTREYVYASATSTYYNDYTIELWATGAPAGTIFVDPSNKELPRSTWKETATWRLPVTSRYTTVNANGAEYYGRAKLCIPVETATPSGEITLHSAAKIMQYEIYLAYNKKSTQQSYIISDPSKGTMDANAVLTWGSEMTEKGKLQITKVGGGGMVLPGATFTLTGTDGSTRTGTTDNDGEILWDGLDPDVTYTLTETDAPAGYAVVDPMQVNVKAAQTSYVTVQDSALHKLVVRKIDRQTGYSLNGAVIRFEQIDGSFTTTKTTDHAGMIQMDADKVPIGSYKVYEVTAPEGYDLDPTVQTVHWDGKKDVTLTLNNVRKPTLTIYKCDEGNHYNLPGATFEVYKNGQRITTVTTNDNGLAYVSGISTGYYTVKETIAPPGYVLDGREHSVYVDLYDPATTDDPRLVVENAAKPSLRIVKYDRQSMKPLPDTTFKVSRDTVLIGTYTTDAGGEILLTALDPGTYTVEEVAAPGSHVVNSTPQQIELKAGQTEIATLIFLNSLKPGIHLVKLDSETMKPLVNATYLISKVGGTFAKEYTTDANGEIDLSALELGAYTVREISAPEGYLIDDGIRTIQLNPDENAQFVFTDTPKPGMVVVKYDPQNDKYLAGATFRIAKLEDGSRYLDRVTDTQGRIALTGMEPGIYSVQELAAPEGYVKNDTEYHVELFPGKTSEIVVTNEALPNLKIIKTDAITGEPIEGVTFTVRKADSATVTTVTTGKDGKVLIEKLEPGVYEVTEQSVPDDYLLDTKAQQVTLAPGRTATVQFQNYRKPTLVIEKTDPDGKPIVGAIFQVKVKNGDVIGDYTTGADGKITVPKLLPQYYTVTEVSVPDAFILDPTPRDVLLEAGKTTGITIRNERKPGLIIYKIDSVTRSPIQNAKFHIWYAGNGDAAGTLTDKGFYFSDENGRITLSGLAAGWYRVTEVEPATGYELKDPSTQDIYMKESVGGSLTFENIPKSALVILKRDADSGKPLPGAKFQLRYLSGVSGTGGTIIGTYTTNHNGAIVVTNLQAGTYVAEETQAPDGYVIDGAAQTVYLTGKTQDVITVEFTNRHYAGLVIRKLDSVTREPLAGVTFKVTDAGGAVVGASNGLYTTDKSGVIQIPNLPTGSYVVQETKTAPGYVLDDTAQTVKVESNKTHTLTFYNTPEGGLRIVKTDADSGKRIPGVKFEVALMNGAHIGTYTTDRNGLIVLTDIASDWYTVTELKAADGYRLDTTPHNFEVKNGKTTAITIENSKASSILLHKIDSVTGKGIYGVTFLLCDARKNPIGTYTTDQSGYAYIDEELTAGKYFVRELDAPTGYIPDEGYKTVYVRVGETSTVEWKNTAVTGQIQVCKYSADANSITGLPAGNALPGAVFEVVRAKTGMVVGYITTDARGVAATGALPLGRYTVKEVTPPAYYQPDAKAQEATLKIEGDVVRLAFYNRSATLGVTIRKTGNQEAAAGNSMRYDFMGIANTSNVSLSDFYWHDRIPTDAVRANVLFTGTYSQRLTYRVLYKTNYQDYRVLASNLLSTSNYAFHLDALALMSGEVVTDVRLEFGAVPAGFRSMSKPMLTVTVLPTVANGYQIVNRADVGGKYLGVWQTAPTSWLTIVRKLGPAPTLPKTGY